MPVEIPKELPLLGKLPAHWRAVEFGSVLDGGTRNGIYKQKEFHGRGAKMVNMGELFAHPRLRAAVEMRRVELSDNEYERFNLRSGDLLFARRSLVASGAGKCIVVLEINEPTTFESSIIRARPNLREADGLFLFYLFSSPYGTYVLGSILRHVAVAGITGSDLVKLLIPLPPPAEQRAIASVLGALDDKIELNRRMNETLEALAQSLFKSWFVDAAQAGLPTGWEERGLDEIANFLNGLALQKFPPNGDDSLPVIKIAQLRAGHTDGADLAETNLPSQYIIEDGDVLFSWSGSLLVDIWCGGRGALNQHLFKVTSQHFPKWFYFLWTRHHLPEFQAIAAGKATTMGHIQRRHLNQAKVLVPTTAELEKMDKKMSPLVEKLIANNLESSTLAALRDALLPKLLSGELRVPAIAALSK
jgi:type I restriction enzyme S subunit